MLNKTEIKKETQNINPGSREAVEQGCKCPILDNAHGRGCPVNGSTDEPFFWIAPDCAIHNKGKNYES